MKKNSAFLRKFSKRKASVISAFLLLILIFTAIFGPSLCKRYHPNHQNQAERFAPISRDHWLGTDYAGRDIFTRLVYGAKFSISVSFFGVLAGGIIGVFLGLVSGYFGGVSDNLISRLIELLMAVPGLLLAIIIIAVMGKSDFNTVISVAVSVIASFTRIIRSSVISLRESDYVKSAYILGASDWRIIFTHILPNCISFIIVTFTLNLGTALLTVSSLSFLGIGVQPPNPEWGSMISLAKEYMLSYPLGILAPGLAITIFVISSSLVGDGLRDALDPRI
ncbi:MAG: ABC transporter permease [Lachnospiraceae bacterium]|nr:ABC transporter permease [Lachnospiraceae bacterium]